MSIYSKQHYTHLQYYYIDNRRGNIFFKAVYVLRNL